MMKTLSALSEFGIGYASLVVCSVFKEMFTVKRSCTPLSPFALLVRSFSPFHSLESLLFGKK